MDYGINGDQVGKVKTHDDHDDFADSLALGCYELFGVEKWHMLPPDVMEPMAPKITPQESRRKKTIYIMGGLRI